MATATIVTHQGPDLDACVGVWLVKRYIKGFFQADVVFVSSGKTYQNEPADSDPRIIHVDTGGGKFDHHHLKERSSAATRIVAAILSGGTIRNEVEKATLERLAEVTTFVDNFEECLLHDADADFYDLGLHQLIRGYRIAQQSDHKVMEWALQGLDSYYYILANKVRAELEIAQGVPFTVGTVSAIGLLSGNEEALVLAEKQGYELVVRKDPEAGIARIKLRPDSTHSLKKLAEKIIHDDPEAHWFLHTSERMLLNGSRKHITKQPTRFSLQELISIVKTNLL